jgi:hypothetical protein
MRIIIAYILGPAMCFAAQFGFVKDVGVTGRCWPEISDAARNTTEKVFRDLLLGKNFRGLG